MHHRLLVMISTPNVFSGAAIDRLAERRNDADWIAAALACSDARFLVAWDELSPIHWHNDQPAAAFVDADAAAPWLSSAREVVLLGENGGRVMFGLNFDEPPAAEWPWAPTELKSIAGLLDARDAALLAWFRALCHWHREHRFCPRCGRPTAAVAAGHERVCGGCSAHHYPRVDPAIIVLVERGDKCLLGRQAKWPARRFSTLAGFVEPGESLEDAVAREVFEEAGVKIAAARYHSSQPWPFPASLMLGFFAEAASPRIVLNDGELEEARWFSREDIAEGLKRGDFKLPSLPSVAFRLVRDWYERGGGLLALDPLSQREGRVRGVD